MVTSHQAEIRAQGAPVAGDLGPLAWVLEETRKSIESATRSLKRFAHEAEAARGVDLASVDASQLRMARQQLHQVVGALDMVGQTVSAHMVRGMEGAVQQFVQYPEKCNEAAAQTLERAGFALVEYLEAQLGERPRSALGLFPQFKQVQEMAGADRVHPADLWAWPWRWADPATPVAAQPLSYGPEVRGRLDQRVLKIMKHADFNAASEVGVISLGLAQGEGHRQPAIFWKLSSGFFEALGKALIPMDVYTKRTASRILLQYTTLAQGDQRVSERLAQDLLFFCAQAVPQNDADAPVLGAIRRAWSLERHHAEPYDQLTFGLYDPAVLQQARRRIDAVKENWSALAGGDLARMKACVDQFGLVAESLSKLHDKGNILGDALNRVAHQTAQAGKPPSAELAMETATAVLFLEASFEDFQPSDATFVTRLQQLTERLDAVRGGATAPPLEPWMEQLYRSVSDRQTMGTVVSEVRATLGEVEQHLDQFFRNPADKGPLGTVPGLMAQMRGVLSVLGLDQAALAVGRMRDVVDEWLTTELDPDQIKAGDTFEKLGSSLGALGFQVDMLGYQPVLARKLFVYDADTGELKHVTGRVVHEPVHADDPMADTIDIELDFAAPTETVSITDARPVDDISPPSVPSQPAPVENTSIFESLTPAPTPQPVRAFDEAGRGGTEDDFAAILPPASVPAPAPAPTPVAAPAPVPVASTPVATPAPQVAATPVPDESTEEDDELLDIFLEEAREVVQTGGEAIAMLADAPGDIEQQTTLRRAFHTLKGSSRMVGLSEFGEAAWSMEQLLNAWLSEQKPVTEDLRGLTMEAMQGFGAWVEDIAAKRATGWSSAPFREAADAWRVNGQRVPLALGRAAVAESVPPASTATITVSDVADPAPSAPVAEQAQPEQAPAMPEPVQAFELPDLELTSFEAPASQPPVETVTLAAPTIEAETVDFDEFVSAQEAVEEASSTIEVVEMGAEDSPALSDDAWMKKEADAAWDAPVEVVEAPLTVPEPEQSGTLDVFASAETAVAVESDASSLALDLSELDFATTNEPPAPAPAVESAPTMDVSFQPVEPPVLAPSLLAPAAEDTPPSQAEEPLALDLGELAFATAQDAPSFPPAPPAEEPLAPELSEPKFVAAQDASSFSAVPPAPVAAPSPSPYEQELPSDDDEMYKQIGDLRISAPLYSVYLNEADEWSRQLVIELAEWSLELHLPVPERAIARAHSLAGSSATVGFTALSELARAVEHALQRLHGQHIGTVQQASVLSEAAEDIRRVLHQFAVGELKTPSADILVAVNALEPTSADDIAADGGPVEPAPVVTAAAEIAPRPIHVPPVLPEVAAPAPMASTATVTTVDVPRAVIADDIDATDAIDPDLFPIFEEEAEELLPQLSAAMRQWTSHPDDRGARAQVLRALHTLKGSARLAGAMRLGEMAHRTESAIETIGTENVGPQDVEPLLDQLDDLLTAFRRLQAGDQGAEVAPTVPAPVAFAPVQSAPPPSQTVPPMQPAMPAPVVSVVPPKPAPVVAPVVAPPMPAVSVAPPQPQPQPQQPIPVAAQAPAPAEAPVVKGEVALPAGLSLVSARAAASQAVRVRSQLLDRLVNQAGEVVTSRARLEAEIGQLRSSLTDLTGNLDRLRQQLRDVELQAETQMQSRLALSKDAQQNFDPLEFDRFTRMQELTRIMAESVNDVATVQRSLQRAVDASEDDLAAQARQSRELQRDLLRTRMVEFESISERLYRVVRQASKETGKQVRLDIVGGSIEVDRGILDRMTPAFEHLLRNCVVHGIETQAVRSARNKDPVGLIGIEIQQSGNDVAVQFRDDGTGLNLPRIRERAQQQGLVTPDQQLSDAEVANLVFAPGFTTATEVTELAGRGVGMDVVRTEVQALGGRIETQTREGLGSSFRLVLPLTTAVTHVVMLRAGRLSIGVPSNMVDIVQRVSERDLQAAYRTGTFRFGDEQLPFFWSGALLQSSARTTEPQARTTPVMIFRSAEQRVAVHVDEVLGNQEVVVKALGPQLSRLPGLVAITALASGAVALIYNPVALAAVYGDQARALSAAQPQVAVAEATAGTPVVPEVELHSHIPLVLVVDDSITVRRVTQRLLQREGYRVALAADGLQGLEKLQDERPAVVLSDIEMPRMDGFDFVRNIRADDKLRDLPVIMITSRIAEKHREHARELGVDHYLGKPYSEEELLGLIKDYAAAAAAAQA